MRRAWTVLAGWGALLLVWTAAQLPFSPDGGELALLGGAGLFCLGLGGIALLVERRRARRPAPEEQPVPDASAPTALLAVGICVALSGLELGPWAAYLGGGLTLVGLGALVRERRAERAR